MLQVLFLRVSLVILALLCFVFGFLTVRKGVHSLRDNAIDGIRDHHLVQQYAPFAVSMGGLVFLFGFFLLYLLTMF